MLMLTAHLLFSNHPALIDGNGYVYYIDRHHLRDTNQYELLTERAATHLEVIYLKYHDVFYNKTVMKEAPPTKYSVYNLKNCNYNDTQNAQATLSMERTEEKTWTHSFQLGLSSSAKVKVIYTYPKRCSGNRLIHLSL